MPATTGGLIDSTALSQVMLPRCGVPDNDHTTKHYSFLKGRPTWKHSKPLTLNYALSPTHVIGYINVLDIRVALERAFSRWSSVIPVKFEETQDYKHANITIGFYHGDHGDGNPFDDTVLAHATTPGTGAHFIHFNAAFTWAVDFYFEKAEMAIDLESVVIHEIGHVIGLDHSSNPEAVMYLGLSPRTKKLDLTLDDVNGAQALYSSNPNFNSAIKSFGLREIITISVSLVVKTLFFGL